MIVHCINLPKRTDRRLNAIQQSKEQGFQLKFIEGIVVPGLPFVGISRSHKEIIREAKRKGLDKVFIMEDDCVWVAPKAFDYFISQIPDNFDLFLSMVYEGEIDENNRLVRGFSGLTCYIVNGRFYDTFLGMKEMNNLDRELGNFAWKYKYYVCREFPCFQMDGYSDSKFEERQYSHLLEGRKMYEG